MASKVVLIEKVDAWMHSTIDERVFDKKSILELLRRHQVDVHTVERPEVLAQEIIPALKKARVHMPEAFFRDLASELQMPFADSSAVKKYAKELEKQIVTIFPYYVVDKYRIVPIEINKKELKVALCNPVDPKIGMTLSCLFKDRDIELVVASSGVVERVIDTLYREIHKEMSLFDLYRRMPDQSAHKVLIPRQKVLIIAFLAVTIISAVVGSVLTFAVLFALVNVAYFIINPVKIYISL